MHGYKYTVGDRVYRSRGTYTHSVLPIGRGTVLGHNGRLVLVQFDNGLKWYCDIKFIKPLVRVVG
ncbi:hypothetical protein APK37_12 [Acinetobacter phage vB_AbaP_APK37]|uniref:Uncharacterized protein n=1 Tax=Acinetobacter phage vB_AbaP_APK37 TaxID=2500564 RepID=A0A5H2UHR2_9CAUD|nr:hypothetical protein APK37_12 [Acinetobacter phage vB_AbaP_APK37]